MTAAGLPGVAARAWAALYTAGLSPERAGRRRLEIASDTWEHDAWGAEAGLAHFTRRQVTSRLIRGIYADLAWRWETGRLEEANVAQHLPAAMPWFTSLFLGAVTLWAAVTVVVFPAFSQGDRLVSFAVLGLLGVAALGAGTWMASFRPNAASLLIAAGGAAITWGTLPTVVGPVLGLIATVFGLARVERLRKHLTGVARA